MKRPGDQVLALVRHFQQKFTGPYSYYYFIRQVSDKNYLIDTPNCKKSTQLCHVNLLKCYYSWLTRSSGDAAMELKPVVLAMVNRLPLPPSDPVVAAGSVRDASGPGDCVLHPRLNISETLADLRALFGHLSETNGGDMEGL